MKRISFYLHQAVAEVIKKELERIKAEEDRAKQLAKASRGEL
jgi:hypothetical protein